MITPHEAAAKRQKLSEEYSYIAERYGELTKMAVRFLNSNRSVFGSDKATQVAWDVTGEGQEMIGLKYKMKGLEREISGLKTLIDVANNEARNIF